LKKPLISIIIPTHNSKNTIKRCLDSITTQSCPREQYEVIIVDDGSTDNTESIAEKAGADRIIVTKPCFQGKARNIGVNNTNAEFLAFIDSDCMAKEGWIDSILTELQKSDAITGPIENGNSNSHAAWAEYLIEFGGWDEYRSRSFTRFIPGCNQAYTKKIFEKTGGFTESPSSEDVLFGESLRNIGIKPVFVPSIQIYHLCRTEKEKVLKNMKLIGKYAVRARIKNPSIAYSSIMTSKKLIPLIFFAKLIKTLGNSIKAKKFTKFVISFPIIIQGITFFCKGVWEEAK